jgi:hypothetical protein
MDTIEEQFYDVHFISAQIAPMLPRFSIIASIRPTIKTSMSIQRCLVFFILFKAIRPFENQRPEEPIKYLDHC